MRELHVNVWPHEMLPDCFSCDISPDAASLPVVVVVRWWCRASFSGYAFRLKTGMGRGGAIERVSYANCTVHKAGFAFFYGENYGTHARTRSLE